MIEFKRILFPIDLSEQSRRTMPLVAAMAARFGSDVLVLHVMNPQLSYYPIPAAASPASLHRDRQEREAEKTQFSAFLRGLPTTLSIEPVLLEGDAADCIVSCAEEPKVDLIMMPTHGWSRFRRLLFGSVTAKVLHDVECPVWTGVHTDGCSAERTDRWTQLICAVGDDLSDAEILQWAAIFASEQSANLHVVHAIHATGMLEGVLSDSFRDFLFEVARKNLERLQAKAGTRLEIQLKFGPVADAIRNAALEYRADLMVIGRGASQKGLGRLRSATYSIIRAAPCPVISL